jgi:hypothetical protein
MTFAKIDHPRRIDQFVDSFGETRGAAAESERPWEDARDLPQPRRREAETACL